MVLPYKIGGEGIAIHETQAIPHIYQGTILRNVMMLAVTVSDKYYKYYNIYIMFSECVFLWYLIDHIFANIGTFPFLWNEINVRVH